MGFTFPDSERVCLSDSVFGYQLSQNSILMVRQHYYNLGYLYSFSCEKAQPTVKVLKWSKWKAHTDVVGMVSTLNQRYILGFGKCDGTHTSNTNDSTDRKKVTVFDMKKKSVFMSSNTFHYPVQSYKAVLLGSERRNELTVFGFVNQAYIN